MPSEYLYVFGYENLEDRVANAQGYDQESFGCFRILAHDEDGALAWGQKLSHWYVSHLFRDIASEGSVWDPSRYANWIEPGPDSHLTAASAKLTPVVSGCFPSFSEIRAAFAD